MFRRPVTTSKRGRRRLLVALASICLQVGCGSEAAPVEQRRAAIVGGTSSGPNDDAVVFLGGCSGVLVAAELLLTSLECVSERSIASYTQPFSCTAGGELDNGGSGGGELGPLRPADAIRVFIGAELAAGGLDQPAAIGRRIVATPGTHFCRNNLAFVVLDRRLEHVPVLPLRLESRVQVGEQLTLIGYGGSSESAAGVVRSRRDARVLALASPPRTFQVGAGPCARDAGSPAVSDAGLVVGIHGLISGSPCDASDVRNLYTEIAAYRQLVEEAFAAAGASAEPAAGESPAGDEPGGSRLTAGGGCSTATCARGPDSFWPCVLLGLSIMSRRRTQRRRRRASAVQFDG